jgi:hypothetical protein
VERKVSDWFIPEVIIARDTGENRTRELRSRLEK